MWKYKGIFKRNTESGKTLSADELHLRALRQIRAIALTGVFLLLADLAMSLSFQGIPIVSENGALYLIRPAAGDEAGHISLRAEVRSAGRLYENSYDIRLDPQQSRAGAGPADDQTGNSPSGEDLILTQLRAIASGFNEDLRSRRVPLPSSLPTGETIRWSRQRSSNALYLCLLTAFAVIAVYRSRFRPIQKQEESRRASVRRQLPAFLNELVLLLNAGLVLSRAFEKAAARPAEAAAGPAETAAGGPAADRSSDPDYFRGSLVRICQSVKNTNGAMHEELRAFARESGVSELMRVSNIISDNINKGAELCVKLERESESLWLARKHRAEERGRLAETRMTLPLSIFLCVLIIVTVSPALLQI